MPKELTGGFLQMLYVVGAMCDPTGAVRFNRKAGGSGRPITRTKLAAAARCDAKDASRYLHAAEASGVLTVVGERKNGTAPLYQLCMHPFPDWEAAVRSLAESRRDRRKKPAPWRTGADQGGRSPSVAPDNHGGPAPSVDQQYPADTERDRPPTDQGGRSPHDRGGPAPSHTRGSSTTSFHEQIDRGAQGADRARESESKTGPATPEWGAGVPAAYAFRAAAKQHLQRQGETPTAERVDAYAQELYARSQDLETAR